MGKRQAKGATEMTRSEAKRKLMDAYPGKSVCICVHDWYYDHRLGGELQFTVSVLPGVGTTCDQWNGSSLDEAMAKALAPLTPATPFDPDELFEQNDRWNMADLAAKD
jgi:hypothetical protein